MKMILYGIIVGCFAVAGVFDAHEGEWKAALIAWLLGVANGLIFLWR